MPTAEGYNLPRLLQLRESIAVEAGLGKHYQGSWGQFVGKVKETFNWPDGGLMAAVSCPTSACAAGWTTMGAGAKMLVDMDVRTGKASGSAEHVLTKDGEVRRISEYAAELLGLDSNEQARLFSAEPSTRETLHSIDQLIVAAKHKRTWWDQIDMERAASNAGKPIEYDAARAEIAAAEKSKV